MFSQQSPIKVKVPAQEDSLNYLLYLPGGYDRSGHSWPLMIFLHGSGERGSDIEIVKKNGPPKLIEQGQQFPFIVASPQCPAGVRWSVKVLDQFLDSLLSRYSVDTSRIYLTGLSMGGEGTWNWAMADPARFAAIAPVCGNVDTTHARNIKDMPTWVFHGAQDDVVPITYSDNMVKVLRRMGNQVIFTIYPEAGHDSWTETYNNPVLYQWMMGQRR